jgi:dipeptidyl aminopeptidase/acylaminoacyl peptidase
MPSRVSYLRWLPIVAACTVALPAIGQQRVVTAADYARAERAMTAPAAVTALADAGRVTPNWLANDQFWYRTSDGQFLLVDPLKKTKLPAFDHAKVAAAMARASGKSVDAQHLPFATIAFTKDYKSIMVADSGKEWSCDVKGSKCTSLAPGAIAAAAAPVEAGAGRGGRGGRGGGGGGRGGGRGGAGGAGGTSSHGEPLNMSPDGQRGVYIHDWNLWVKETAGGAETQLTTDGVKDFGYATNNAGWTGGPTAVGVWSPDGKRFATQQQDERGVGQMYLVSTPVGTFSANGRDGGHPVLRAWAYPLPGDSVITTIQRVIIDVGARKVVRLKMGVDQHRGTVVDNLNVNDMKWRPDGSEFVFASSSRDHKHVWLRSADPVTGAVREVFDESAKTQFEGGPGQAPLWRVEWASNEVLWWSERDGWGHFYLYDLATGKLKNKINSGDGVVTNVSRINDTTRTMWFTEVGHEAGQNPYYNHFYRIQLDGTKEVSLTPDDGTHEVQSSPDGKYLVDTWSKTDVPYASSLRDATTGALVMPLEKGADPAALKAAGWNPVETIKMKARDGKTDIYGIMFKPGNLDPSKKYPIINNIYPGPQSGSNGAWGWTAAGGDASALAALGFVVVKINGMGTPNRSKAFHDAYYANMGDNTLPDQVSGMKELGQRYSWIDMDRVGIWGHSGGGFATAGAMFHFPDFFKVGIAESGNHDNREYEDDWGERYQGLDNRGSDPRASYDTAANQNFAKNLKGHLMLAHGTMDNNVPPYNTLLIVDQLIKANKDFDLLLIPNSGHGYPAPASSYMERRRWDYFVKWLMGAEGPVNYQMGTQGGGRGGAAGRGRAGGAPPAGGGGLK